MAALSERKREALGYNPERTVDLWAMTTDGYIIAQDIASQHEYVLMQSCETCGSNLVPVAQINRSFQGLSEVVAICPTDGTHHSFIFDISNEVYQNWWASRMGELYMPSYEGPARVADPKQRYFNT